MFQHFSISNTSAFVPGPGRPSVGVLRWLQSPLAFACPRLESEFVTAQRAHFSKKTYTFMSLIAIISLTCWARMFPAQLQNTPLHVWNTTYVLALAFCLLLFHQPHNVFSGAWSEIAIVIRLLCCMQAVVVRPRDPPTTDGQSVKPKPECKRRSFL